MRNRKRLGLRTAVLVLAVLALAASAFAVYSAVYRFRGGPSVKIELLFDRLEPGALTEYQNWYKTRHPGQPEFTGTELEWGHVGNPYVISDKRHMQNLSYLQKAGFFENRFLQKNAQGQYTRDSIPHFLVCDSKGNARAVNCSGITISAIGTETHPFYGSIVGYGKGGGSQTIGSVYYPTSAIHGLTVRTGASEPDVGLFAKLGCLGYTNGASAAFNGVPSELSNLIFSDIKISAGNSGLGQILHRRLVDIYKSLGDQEPPDPQETHHLGIVVGHVEYARASNLSIYYSGAGFPAVQFNDPGCNYFCSTGYFGLIDNLNPQVDSANNVQINSGISHSDITYGYSGGGGLDSGVNPGYLRADDVYRAFGDVKDPGTGDVVLVDAKSGSNYLANRASAKLPIIGDVPSGFYIRDGVFTFALSPGQQRGSGGGTAGKDTLRDIWRPGDQPVSSSEPPVMATFAIRLLNLEEEPTDPTGETLDPSAPTDESNPTDPTGNSDPTDPTGSSDPTDPTGNSDPTDPTGSSDPTDPTGSSDPTDPTGSSDPTDPTGNSDPTDPTGSSDPTDPTGNSDPTDPTGSSDPTDPTGNSDPTDPTGSSDPTDPTGNSDPTDPTGSSDPTDPTGNSDPTDPTGSSDPTDPTGSSDPTDPTGSSDPTDPTGSSDPTDPTGSSDPTDPTGSSDPTDPTGDSNPTDPTDPTGGSNPTDPTDPTGGSDPTDPTDSSDPTDPTEEMISPFEETPVLMAAEGGPVANPHIPNFELTKNWEIGQRGQQSILRQYIEPITTQDELLAAIAKYDAEAAKHGQNQPQTPWDDNAPVGFYVGFKNGNQVGMMNLRDQDTVGRVNLQISRGVLSNTVDPERQLEYLSYTSANAKGDMSQDEDFLIKIEVNQKPDSSGKAMFTFTSRKSNNRLGTYNVPIVGGYVLVSGQSTGKRYDVRFHVQSDSANPGAMVLTGVNSGMSVKRAVGENHFALNLAQTAPIYIYAVYNHQQLNTSPFCMSPNPWPPENPGLLPANQYVLWPDQSFAGNTTGGRHSTGYAIKSLEGLGWKREDQSPIFSPGDTLGKMFDMKEPVDWALQINVAGYDFGGLLNGRIIHVPVGSGNYTKDVCIPAGSLAFHINKDFPADNPARIRVIVKVPTVSVGINGTTDDYQAKPDSQLPEYYLGLWRGAVKQSQGIQAYSFNKNDTVACVEVPLSQRIIDPDRNDSFNPPTLTPEVLNSRAVNVTYDAPNDTALADSGHTFTGKTYLQGDSYLLAYEFQVTRQGVYILATTTSDPAGNNATPFPMQIAYCSVDGIASSGRDGTGGAPLGSIDFVYDNGSSVIPVTQVSGAKVPETLENMQKYYFSTNILLHFNNVTLNADNTYSYPRIAGETLNLCRDLNGAAEQGRSISRFTVTSSQAGAGQVLVSKQALDCDDVVQTPVPPAP